MRATRRAVAVLTAILLGWPAAAHLVSGTRSLRERVEEADLVVRARVVSTSDFSTRSSALAGADRPFVEIEVLEVLKGDPVGKTEIAFTAAVKGESVAYLTLILEDVIVSGFSVSHGGGSEMPSESVSLNFTKFDWSFTGRDKEHAGSPTHLIYSLEENKVE